MLELDPESVMVWMCWHQPVQRSRCADRKWGQYLEARRGATNREIVKDLNLGQDGNTCVWLYLFLYKLRALIASHGTTHKILIKSLWQWPSQTKWIMNDISPNHRRSASGQNKWHFYPPRARPNESNWDVNPSLSSARHPQRIRGKENRLIEAFARTKHDSTDL